jgi:hypothetical protein
LIMASIRGHLDATTRSPGVEASPALAKLDPRKVRHPRTQYRRHGRQDRRLILIRTREVTAVFEFFPGRTAITARAAA